MKVRWIAATLLVGGLATVIGGALGERVSRASDAPFWTWLPWGLLVVFWVILGLKLWRSNRGGSDRSPP